MRTRTTSTARWASAVAAVALLAGCGGGSGDDGPEGAASADPSVAASPTTSPTEPATESPAASATPTPASGLTLRMDVVEVNVPAGWKKLDPLVPLATTAGDPEGTSTITLSARTSFGGTLDELATISARTGGRAGQVRRAPDTEIAGVPVYHLVDKPAARLYAHSTLDEYAAVHEGQVVTLIINLERGLGAAERTRIHDEVLASLVWK